MEGYIVIAMYLYSFKELYDNNILLLMVTYAYWPLAQYLFYRIAILTTIYIINIFAVI